jgi:hypothetical protein
MRLAKLLVTPACVVACCFLLASPAFASYREAHFCNFVVQPGAICGGTMAQSDWERVRTRYPGAQSDNVFACVYMFNFRTNQYRGGVEYCAYTWDSNPLGHYYGATTQTDYKSYNQLGGSNTPHTLVGWTCADCPNGPQ